LGTAQAALHPVPRCSEGRLAQWNKAASALPMIDVLQPALARIVPLWLATTTTAATPVIIATQTGLAPKGKGTEADLVRSSEFQRLTLPAAIAGIRALRPSMDETTVLVVGPEAEALSELRPKVTTRTNLDSVFIPKDGNPALEMAGAWKKADEWFGEITLKLRACVNSLKFSEIPKPCLECAENDSVDGRILSILARNDGAEMEKYGLDNPRFRMGVMRTLRTFIHKGLNTACIAYAMAYLLNSSAKLVSDAQMGWLVAAAPLDLQKVRHYARLSAGLENDRCGHDERIKMARRIVGIVGPGSEKDVSEEFGISAEHLTAGETDAVSRPSFTVLEKKEAPPPAAPHSHAHSGARAAKTHRLSAAEWTVELAKQLHSVPKEFIATCVAAGMRNADRIYDRYLKASQHSGWKSK
jgi:hypothetical protein